MKIAFGINTNGLGHVTRSIPIIEMLLKQKHEVYIFSGKRPLTFCKQRFGTSVHYIELQDYSLEKKTFTKSRVSMHKFLLHIPTYLKEIEKEHTFFKKYHKKTNFDLILSDTRFGIYHKNIPSYLLYHHIKMTPHLFFGIIGLLFEMFTVIVGRKFDHIIVPDHKTNSLSGDLAHNLKVLHEDDLSYIGHLSMLSKQKTKQDIDYFFSISGPEPQRTIMEKKVLQKLPLLKDKKVIVTLGKPEKKTKKIVHGAQVHSYLNQKEQSNIMNRAKLVITRSGYTTIMDLAELGKKALLIPTKGQPEQEYLAKYLMKSKTFYAKDLNKLNIPKDLEIASTYPGYQAKHKTNKSIEHLRKIIGI